MVSEESERGTTGLGRGHTEERQGASSLAGVSSHRRELGLHPGEAGSLGRSGKGGRGKRAQGRMRHEGFLGDLEASLGRDSKRTVGWVLWLTAVKLPHLEGVAGDQSNRSHLRSLNLTWAT